MSLEKQGDAAERVWTEFDAIAVIAFAMLMASGVILANILGRGYAAASTPLGFVHVVVMCIPAAFAISLVLIRCLEFRTNPLCQLGITRPLPEIGKGILVGVLMALAAIPISYITGVAYTKHFGFSPESQPVMQTVFNEASPLWLSIAAAIVMIAVTPLAEEIMYRGVLVSVLRHRHGNVLAVLLSAVFFSLLHIHLPAAPALFFVGVLLAVAYIGSGSVLLVTAMHGAFNAVNLGISAILF